MKRSPNLLLHSAMVITLGLQFLGCRHSIADQEEIQILVISHAIQNFDDKTALYFISIGPNQHNPAPEMFEKIQKLYPQTRLASSASSESPFLEQGTGKRGVHIQVGEPKFTSFHRASIELGITAGVLAGSGSEISLQVVHGKWQIISIKPTWVS